MRVNSIPKFVNGIGIDGIVPMNGPIPQCANQIWDFHFIWDLFHTMNIALGPIPQFLYFIWDLFHNLKIHFGTYSIDNFFKYSMWNWSQTFTIRQRFVAVVAVEGFLWSEGPFLQIFTAHKSFVEVVAVEGFLFIVGSFIHFQL